MVLEGIWEVEGKLVVVITLLCTEKEMCHVCLCSADIGGVWGGGGYL